MTEALLHKAARGCCLLINNWRLGYQAVVRFASHADNLRRVLCLQSGLSSPLAAAAVKQMLAQLQSFVTAL